MSTKYICKDVNKLLTYILVVYIYHSCVTLLIVRPPLSKVLVPPLLVSGEYQLIFSPSDTLMERSRGTSLFLDVPPTSGLAPPRFQGAYSWRASPPPQTSHPRSSELRPQGSSPSIGLPAGSAKAGRVASPVPRKAAAPLLPSLAMAGAPRLPLLSSLHKLRRGWEPRYG